MNLISILKILNNLLVDFLGPFLGKASPAVMVVLFQEIRTGRKMIQSFFFQRMCVSLCFWGEKGLVLRMQRSSHVSSWGFLDSALTFQKLLSFQLNKIGS